MSVLTVCSKIFLYLYSFFSCKTTFLTLKEYSFKFFNGIAELIMYDEKTQKTFSVLVPDNSDNQIFMLSCTQNIAELLSAM